MIAAKIKRGALQESERTPRGDVQELKGKARSEFGCERSRKQAARGIDEADRLAKSGAGFLDHVTEVIAVIGMVEQVEPLERELQVASLAQLDVLGKADVHVEVRVATVGVVRNDVAVAAVVAGSFRQA